MTGRIFKDVSEDINAYFLIRKGYLDLLSSFEEGAKGNFLFI
jgi:hypothetical protein